MEEDKIILKEWSSYISLYPRLDIETAKKLYKDILNESDSRKKNKMREELINNTLYVVCNFISKNEFYYLNSNLYDMDDIISTCNEIWIEMIDNVRLLEVNSFMSMFNYKFYSALVNKLVSNSYVISDNTVLSTDNFANILYKYICLRKKNGYIDYERFLEFIKLEINYSYYYEYFGSKWFVYTYELFEAIINSCEIKDKEVGLSKTKIDQLKYLLISNALESLCVNIDSVIIADTSDSIIEKIYYEEFLDIIFNKSILTESEKSIVKRRFGLKEFNYHTLEELAKENGMTRERIRQKEVRIIRKLQRPGELRNFVKI